MLPDGTQATPREFRQGDSQIGHTKDCARAEATSAEAIKAQAGALTGWTQYLRAREVLPSSVEVSFIYASASLNCYSIYVWAQGRLYFPPGQVKSNNSAICCHAVSLTFVQ